MKIIKGKYIYFLQPQKNKKNQKIKENKNKRRLGENVSCRKSSNA